MIAVPSGRLINMSSAPLLGAVDSSIVAQGLVSANSQLWGRLLGGPTSTFTLTGDALMLTGAAVTNPTGIPLARLVGGSLTTGGHFLSTSATTLTSFGTLLSTVGSGLTLGSDAFALDSGSTVLVTGPVLSSTGGSTAVVGDVIKMSTASRLTTAGGQPVFRLVGGSVTADSMLSAADPGTILELTGSMLTSLSAGIGVDHVVYLKGGATITSDGGSPFVRSAGSTFTVGGNNPGRLLFATESTTSMTLRSRLLFSVGDTVALLQVDNGAVISRTLDTSPFLQFTGSTVTSGPLESLARVDTDGGLNLNGPLAFVDAAGIAPWDTARS